MGEKKITKQDFPAGKKLHARPGGILMYAHEK